MAATTNIRTAAQQRIEARFGEPIEATIARLYTDGMTQEEVATAIGASRESVIRWMRQYRIEARRPGTRAA